MDGGKPRVIENSEGDRTTPSIVAFTKDDEVLVGQSAKRQAVTNRRTPCTRSKRLIGRRYDDKVVQKDVEHGALQDREGGQRRRLGRGARQEDGAARDLGARAHEDEEDRRGLPRRAGHRGRDHGAAYFNDSQRQATKDAGQIAGLTVKRIINEPTAAALAYGLDKSGGDRKVAVYDLGGGTFDISIIEFADVDGERQFEVLSTNGDTFLGGEGLRQARHRLPGGRVPEGSGVDVRRDPLAMQRLKEAAEKAKIELSSSQQTEVNLPYITADASGPKAPGDEAHARQAGVAGRGSRAENHRALPHRAQGRGLSINDVAEVILVGGQTRMPLVQKFVKDFFGKEPRKDVNPDEAVAVGAAVQAGVLTGEVKDVLLARRHPLSLGIETLGGVMTQAHREEHHHPDKATQVFSTADDNQTAVTIHVLQGERDRASEQQVARPLRPLRTSRRRPAAMPQVEVTFDIDANGILNVQAKDKATGKEQKIVIKASSGLNEEEIKRMVRDAEAHAEEDPGSRTRRYPQPRRPAGACDRGRPPQGPGRQGLAGGSCEDRVGDLRPQGVLRRRQGR